MSMVASQSTTGQYPAVRRSKIGWRRVAEDSVVRRARQDRQVYQSRLPLAEYDGSASSEELPPSRTVGLFAGIGGVELGLHRAGHETTLLCEYDPAAAAVLRERFPRVELVGDVRELEGLPETDVLAAGFPCQDLSISGRAAGISGDRSSLVAHVFRLLDAAPEPPSWLLFENVPFMLRLHNGEGMLFLIRELERRGYNWAYRIVDTRAFGLPQRRQRVLLLASITRDPRAVLLADDVGEPLRRSNPEAAHGFYWTEGHRGVGWSVDCVPPIKVGSGLGIPSPPAIWLPRSGRIVIPDVRDLERLQGFDAGWTEAAEGSGARNARWRLVGNAVSVPVAAWLGECLRSPRPYDASHDWPLDDACSWPSAAWGSSGGRHEAAVSAWPIAASRVPLADFLEYDASELSARAAAGLLHRLTKYGARVPAPFMHDLERLARPHGVSDEPAISVA